MKQNKRGRTEARGRRADHDWLCAHAALDAGRSQRTDPAEQAQQHMLAALQAERFDIRTAINQLGAAASRLRIDEEDATPADLNDLVTQSAVSGAHLDDLISHIHRRLVGRSSGLASLAARRKVN